MKEYLAKEYISINDKGIMILSALFVWVVISLAVVVVYGVTHDTAAVTEHYRSSLYNNSNLLRLERLVLSIYNSY